MPAKSGLRRRRGFGGAAQQSLKAVLAVAGLGFGALVVGWPGLFGPPAAPRQATAERVAQPPEVDLRRARLVGRTGTGRPYRITAKAAQWVDEGSAVALTRPTLSLVRPPGIWTFVRAESGRYRLSDKVVILADGVRVYGGGSTYLETARLRLDLRRGSARTSTRVRGSWPAGRFRAADGGRVTEWGERLALFGASDVVVAPPRGPRPPLPRPPMLLFRASAGS